MLVLVLFGPLLAMWLYLAAMLLLGAVQQAQPPANVAQTLPVPGYVGQLDDLRPPPDAKRAAVLAGQWAEAQDWAILAVGPSGAREPGLWFPPLGPPDESVSPLPFEPDDPQGVAGYLLSGEPYVE
jgi:hypothetical protein